MSSPNGTTGGISGVGNRTSGNTNKTGALIEFEDTNAVTEVRLKANTFTWELNDSGQFYPLQTTASLGKSSGLTSGKPINYIYANNLTAYTSIGTDTLTADVITANERLSVTSNVAITADTANEVCLKLNSHASQSANVMQISSSSNSDYFVINNK